MEKGKGMVSGFCIRFKNEVPEVIMVQDKSSKPLVNGQPGLGLPGGRVEKEDNGHILNAMAREWKEEVGKIRENIPVISVHFAINKTGKDGPYKHRIFKISLENPVPLRKTGVPGEVGPPTWMSLRDVAAGRVPVFHGHLEIIFIAARKMAAENKEMALVAIALAKLLKISLDDPGSNSE